MKVERLMQHDWLQKLVGEWTSETYIAVNPGETPTKFEGSESVRSLDGIWVVAEGRGEMPGGGMATTMMTLGYDPEKQRFVGTWIGSMMTNLWVYEGSIDESGKVLTLNSSGPNFMDGGKIAQFRDVIAFETDDDRTMSSHMLRDDGTWEELMSLRSRRKR